MYTLLKLGTRRLTRPSIEFASELVRTPSPSFGEEATATLVEQHMQGLDFDEAFRDDAGNVVGLMLGREAGPTLVLASHMDTMEGEAESESPLKPGEVVDGELHGPGASDCKGGLAAQVYAAALLRQSLLPLRGNLVVAATVAEANGRSVGMRALLEKTLPSLEIQPDYVVLGEPTNLNLYYGHDGWVEIDIKVDGPNPFHVEDAAQAIYRNFRAEFGDEFQSSEPGSYELQEPRRDQENTHPQAMVSMARRIHAEERVPELLRQVKSQAALAARSSGRVAVEVAVREESHSLYTGRTTVVRSLANAWQTDPYHPLIERSRQALAAAGCRTRCGKWKLDRLGMGTAGALVSQHFNLPVVGYGPGDENMAHTPRESVAVDAIHTAIYGTAAIAHSLIGVPVFGWTSDEV
jgi:acetylornithine deacetylase/succinyl-diaminopimelate desuccinylase-like protein